MSKKLFTQEEADFIKKHIVNYTTQETADLVNKHFGKNYTALQITRFKQYRKLVSGFYGCKKGTLPVNTVPIGTETLTKDGYVIVKVDNKPKGNRKNWKCKHRLLWEQHYGKIPDGYVVVFADQDKTNFELDNLILVERSALLTARTQHIIFSNPELTKTGLLVAKLMNKTQNIRRNNRDIL